MSIVYLSRQILEKVEWQNEKGKKKKDEKEIEERLQSVLNKYTDTTCMYLHGYHPRMDPSCLTQKAPRMTTQKQITMKTKEDDDQGGQRAQEKKEKRTGRQ